MIKVHNPQSLAMEAKAASDAGQPVTLDPDVARLMAEWWHADQEKISYLESLLVRMGRGGEVVVRFESCDRRYRVSGADGQEI